MPPPEANPTHSEEDGQDNKPADPSANLDSQMFLAQRQDKEKFPIQFTVDDFMFVEQLTQSKNSVIWLVNYRFANDLLVLKEINFKRFLKHHWVNLQREFLSVQLIHNSVLRTHGYFFVPNKVYFVQEYAKGGDLYQSLKRQGPFSEERVRKILVQLLDAVEYIHSKNIIHRDLKLDNILFTSTNLDLIKVADFGVCFPKTDSRADPETKVGTLDYMAPEVLKDSQHDSSYDEKVDVWAIGIITYELMHGFPPFSNPNFERTCFNITQSSFEVSPKLSVQATDFINCVLRKAPHERLTIEGMQKHPWIAASKPAVPRPVGPAAQKAAARAQAAADKAKSDDDDKTMVAKMRAEFLTHHVRCEILRRNTKTVLVMTDCPITRQLLSTLLWLKKYKVVMRSSSDAAKIHEQVLEVQAEVYVVDVSPFNIQAMRSAFRSVLNMPVRPILLALVTITQQRQPHVLADMFDYCIHKPVDRNQMEVFPTAISNNFPEGDGIVRNDSTEKPKPDTKTAEAAAPSAATPKKAEEEKPPAPTVASVTPALKAVKLEESAKAPAPAKTPAPDKAPASQKETSLPSVHTGKPAPAKGSEEAELVKRSAANQARI
eukprot:CAMPEP_0114249754 /NCGR_PEP_ID=MMETSP0058-20121206/14321_1 /TAXON_ID=36894 /ORGANISM="Pyramimonas parkeae, CCMP726" /LENGTH=602 /DNA_ID=CAMNT_0001363341 /DNA_START=490 /DNA_END=2299 /DNA_ORIENTATION=-